MQFLEKHSAQLFGGVDVERVPCLLVDGLLQLPDAHRQFFAVLLQSLAVHGDALGLHIRQGKDQGKLHIPVKPIHAPLRQPFLENLRRRRRGVCLIAGVFYHSLRLLFPDILHAVFSKHFYIGRDHQREVFLGHILQKIGALQGI